MDGIRGGHRRDSRLDPPTTPAGPLSIAGRRYASRTQDPPGTVRFRLPIR